ncbi:MAG: DinB family protein [Pirellulaceae bacterium]
MGQDTMSYYRPDVSEYPEYFAPYMALVDEDDLIVGMDDQIDEFMSVLGFISEEVGNQVHALYTWTVKQVVGHILDNERIFAYRALRFASGDTTDLPGYDQDILVANNDYESITLSKLADELQLLRQANIAMFRRFKPEAWSLSGTADGKKISVRAIAALQIGHARYHLDILRKRVGA